MRLDFYRSGRFALMFPLIAYRAFLLEGLTSKRKDERMLQAKQGDTVKVHYTGRLSDGMVFDTSLDREPLQFTMGQDQIIPGFEQAVVGMSPGESKTVEIPADQAYGPYDEEMILVVDRNQIPEHVKPEVDDELKIRRPDGETFVVTVTAISESSMTLDANHSLAGKDLIFDIQLIEIV
jgi:peptidylprolyl isomerase